MPLNDIGLLRFFVGVVTAGSLSGAARAQHITLPSASRKLRQLENDCGVRLLHRTTRRQSLTDEGQLLYARAVRILDDLEHVEQLLQHKNENVTGQLRVTTPISLGRRRIAPLLARFGALHPELQIQVALTDTVLDLVDAGVDVAIHLGGMDDSSYISRPLAPNHRVLCASPDYLRRHGEPGQITDLNRHQCLHIGLLPQAEWRLDDQVVRIQAHLAANDGEVVQQWALDGYGIALKSIWDVAQDLKAGRLKQVLPGHRSPAAPLHAVYPHKHHVAPRVHACIDYLAAHLQRPDEESW
ncbi:Transcriptional regulator [plant metagenome]|uniref:Transcriptional regulator n=1 Tax=plant metagenome TaxID=1297885 RepID=A0A484V1U6_9ZZZZ